MKRVSVTISVLAQCLNCAYVYVDENGCDGVLKCSKNRNEHKEVEDDFDCDGWKLNEEENCEVLGFSEVKLA